MPINLLFFKIIESKSRRQVQTDLILLHGFVIKIVVVFLYQIQPLGITKKGLTERAFFGKKL